MTEPECATRCVRSLRCASTWLLSAMLALLVPASAGPLPSRNEPLAGTIRLSVDATDIVHRIMQVHETIPLSSSNPVTLLYPEWLPGTHGPRGPLIDVAGLTVMAGGRTLPWRRDPVNVYAFHVAPPSGAKSIDVSFQYLTPTDPDQGRVVMSSDIVNVQWNAVALYLAGIAAHRTPFQASLSLPVGWNFATALGVASRNGNAIAFKPVPFDVLVDSPVLSGRWYKKLDLDPGGPSRVIFNAFADRPGLLEVSPQQLAPLRALVQQADRLFGTRHFDHYDFLVSLSERIGVLGLEHHRSSEVSTRATFFKDWDKLSAAREAVSHEYTHSWNGKFRRPDGLLTPDFNLPMQGNLLWVYEGQTQYWGVVLAARSGLYTRAEALDAIALVAATYSARPGRAWRPVEDTVMDPIIAARRPIPWLSWQRSEDYYQEGQLVWLDADTLIRKLSSGKRSLDDFARAFFGIRNGSFEPMPYTFDDIVATLNGVQPYDWATFLRKRVYEIAPRAPLDGLARGGYRLIFVDKPTDYWRSNEVRRRIDDFTFSIGVVLNKDGTLTSVHWNGPAYAAGLTVGTKIVAVNGEPYDAEALRDAIADTRAIPTPIELIVKSADQYRTVRLSYRGGLRYPHLERSGGPPLLDAILSPRGAAGQ